MAVTEADRKANIKLMTLYMSIVIGIIGGYFIGYGCGLMSQASTGFFEGIQLAFSYVFSGRLIPPINIGTFSGFFLGGGLLGGIIYFFMTIDNQKRYHHQDDAVGGTGGFMDKKEMAEYAEKYISSDPPPIKDNLPVAYNPETDEDKYSKNLIMSKHFCRPADARRMMGNNNVLVVGAPGTGKSRYFMKPNLLQMNASYVITDPSGEMIVSLGKVLADHGYKIKLFNISDMTHSNCYNPIHYVRDEAGVKMLIECLINNTTKGDVGGDNQFFVDAEQLLYSACLFYLLEYCHDDSRKNFASVIDMINKSSVNEMDPNAKSELDEIFDELDHSSLAWKYYRSFKQAAGKTLKSIIISCVTRLQPFLIPQVVNLTKTDNLELEKIGQEKTALFIITPQADRTYSFLASMLYSQLFETLYFLGEQQKAKTGDERMKIPVRCMMDEFKNIGEVPEFIAKLSTMRKYNISATVVLQNLAQIEALYPDDWKTLVGNCSSVVFLGSSENAVTDYFSDALGEMTIRVRSEGESKGAKGSSSQNYQSTARKVMTAEELRRLPPDECIVITSSLRPVRDKKYVYEDHPYYDQTGDADEALKFQFQNMSVFNNSKIGAIESLIRAKAEIVRIRDKGKQAARTVNLDDVPLTESVTEGLNNAELDPETEKKVLRAAAEEAIQKGASCGSDPVCMVVVSDIPARFLPQVAAMVSARLLNPSVVVFSDCTSESDSEKVLIGSAIDRDKINLSQYLKTDKVKNFHRTGSITMLSIRKEDFSAYRDDVNKKLMAN